MDSFAIEEILSCESLPSLPATAVRVIELSQDPDCTVNELAETIRFDQGLAAKILKTVNSSFFGLRTKCGTIDKALVVLGLRELRNLALGFSLVPAMESAYTDGFDPIDYWRRGIYSAVAAKFIAQRVARDVADEAFLGGLLQDIGIMAMLQALGKPYEDVLKTSMTDHRKLAAAELRAFDMQHPEVGALLARKWQLPDELSVPIRFHERPTAAPNELREVVGCVALGNAIHQCLTYEDKAACFKRLYDHAQRTFALDQATCDELLTQTATAAKEVSRLFELDTGESVDPSKLLKKASELQSQPASEQDHLNHGSVSAVIRDGDLVDPITGSMTRLAIERQLEAVYQEGKENKSPVSVAIIRIDGYAEIVQNEGLEAGDILAIEITEALNELAETLENAKVGSFDDATSILLTTSPLDALTKAVTQWRESFKSDARPTTSAGLTSCQGDGYDVFTKSKQVLAIAYRAMEAAVNAGGDAMRTFQPGNDKQAA
ncbi:MAG: HDOD domain-containing protein [Phycisphaerales bacterium]|jgi:HD-like signal output (HDOD) protein/GGDEF domain-containing protein